MLQFICTHRTTPLTSTERDALTSQVHRGPWSPAIEVILQPQLSRTDKSLCAMASGKVGMRGVVEVESRSRRRVRSGKVVLVACPACVHANCCSALHWMRVAATSS